MGERNFHLHGNSFNRRAIGTEYETLACEYLTRHGYQILCRNFRYLVFIEVKYRRDEHEGDPAEAVDARKQARILRTARYYMTRYHISEDTPCRFDVVAVLGSNVRLIRDAFWCG